MIVNKNLFVMKKRPVCFSIYRLIINQQAQTFKKRRI